MEFVISCLYRMLHAESIVADGFVRTAGNAEQDDAKGADDEGGTSVVVGTEGGYRLVVLTDVHGLDDAQVVVEREHGVDQGDEHQHVPTSFECGGEDEELREEACKRGNAGQREEGQREQEGNLGVGVVEAVVVFNRELVAA